jgi:hypothetical protein
MHDWQVGDHFYAPCIPSSGVDPKGQPWRYSQGAVIGVVTRLDPRDGEAVLANVIMEEEEQSHRLSLYFHKQIIRPVDVEHLETLEAALALPVRRP